MAYPTLMEIASKVNIKLGEGFSQKIQQLIQLAMANEETALKEMARYVASQETLPHMFLQRFVSTLGQPLQMHYEHRMFGALTYAVMASTDMCTAHPTDEVLKNVRQLFGGYILQIIRHASFEVAFDESIPKFVYEVPTPKGYPLLNELLELIDASKVTNASELLAAARSIVNYIYKAIDIAVEDATPL